MRAGGMLARLLAALVGVALLGPSASANETLTYTYDALGRLVKVVRTGTVNNNASECYGYDPASNRSNVTVNTSSDCATTTITLSPSSLPNGTVGTAYSQTITASGGTSPYTFAKTAGTLPTSLTLTSGGLLSGTPSATGTYSFTVTATDSATHTGSQAYSVTIGSTPTCSGVVFTITSNGPVTEGTNSVFTVTKSGTTSNSCSVNYATADGTAVQPGDYTAKSGTLTFTSAQTSQMVNVTTIDDTVVESAETFSMSLSSPTGGATLGTPSSATATINDNDSANHPPVAVNDTGTQSTCSTVDYNVTANDSDPDGDPISVTAVTGNGFSVLDSQTVEFTSLLSTGAKVGTYTIQDSHGATAQATLTVTVTSGGQCQAPPPAPGP